MKNLKDQFKLIICVLLFLNTFNILMAKNIDKFYSTKDVTNYFSGILAINDSQYQKSYDYLKIYSGKCDRILYETASYCNRKVIYAKQNQEVRICHNPIFVYGNLNVYDQSNNEVFKFIIDGGDCVYLDVSTYPIGSYRIQMINTETDPKTPYNLELIIY